MSLRIYNLFPKLVGSMARWLDHLDRIQEMGFDWVYVNPWHYPGYSGSMYAVKDYYRYADLFLEGPDPGDVQLSRFLSAAHARGLKVMMDLVINHTAFDAELVQQHPEWYDRAPDGSILHPGCLDNGEWISWGDLAQIDHLGPRHDALWAYWLELMTHYLDLGVDGFRCDAAYHVPLAVWQYLLPAVRERYPETLFFGETLGCPAKDIISLAEVGFDYVFNSSKWWDYQSEWFLKDYRKWGGCAPSIAFPESHDTPRLAAEVEGDEAAVRQRYCFSALMSGGVMMPIGYEFGFRTPIDVVKTTPEAWETPTFDLTAYIRDVHELKAAFPIFGMEGDLVPVETGNPLVVALIKQSTDKSHKALMVLNADRHKWQRAQLSKIADALGVSDLVDVSLGHRMAGVPETLSYDLYPSEIKVFVGINEYVAHQTLVR